MTAAEAVKLIEDYYGKYPREMTRKVVLGYLAEFPEEALDELIENLIRVYSGEYKHTPDVAILEKSKSAIRVRETPEEVLSRQKGEEERQAKVNRRIEWRKALYAREDAENAARKQAKIEGAP